MKRVISCILFLAMLLPVPLIVNAVSEVNSEEPLEWAPAELKTITAIGSIQMIDNQLTFQASIGNMAYTSFYLTNPNRIVIDFPNSIIGTNLNSSKSSLSGVIPSSHPQIQKIRYAMFSNQPPTLRVTMELKEAVAYSLFENESGNEVTLVLKSKDFKVIIDPGHGGRDPGAIGASKSYESAFTLKLSQKVFKLLEQEPQIQPYLTRNEDVAVSLDDRSKFANQLQADLFISLHGNTYTSGKIRGTETYYYRPDSKTLAGILHDHVVKAAKLPGRHVRKEDYRVIKDTKMPAALIEIGYLTNKQDESVMLLEEFQLRTAKAIVAAIKQYLNIP
ncbi:MAG TPA: N-acetylmuramoyl-L-alanine amidase [Bacilli bacterium]